ncbi:MAG: hypothetical protein HQK52_03635 [Oligoflexia bacterium]|nr:hypothetical protein [Oligoflexia bacterium]
MVIRVNLLVTLLLLFYLQSLAAKEEIITLSPLLKKIESYHLDDAQQLLLNKLDPKNWVIRENDQQEIIKTPLKLVLIKQNALIFTLDLSETYTLSTPLIAKVYSKVDSYNYYYLHINNGKNELKYMLHSSFTSPFAEDMAIKHTPENFIENTKIILKKENNQDLPLGYANHITFHLAHAILNAPEGFSHGQLTGAHFTFRDQLFIKTIIPVDFGPSLSYRIAYYEDNSLRDYRSRTISYGIALKSHNLKPVTTLWEMSVLAGLEKSLFSKHAPPSGAAHSLRCHLIYAGLDFYPKLSAIILGLTLSKEWYENRSNEQSTNIRPSTMNGTSIAAHLGVRFGSN